MGPLIFGTGRDDIDVPGETEVSRPLPYRGEEILDGGSALVREHQPLDGEPGRRQPALQDIKRRAGVGRHARRAYKLRQQRAGARNRLHRYGPFVAAPNRFAPAVPGRMPTQIVKARFTSGTTSTSASAPG